MDGGLRKLFIRHLPDAQWTSIETGATAQGVPDAEYCFPQGLQGFVEHKRTLGWAVTVRPEQVGWLKRRARMGGRCFIAVRQLGTGRDDLWLIRGEHASLVAKEGLSSTSFPSVSMGHGPDRWDWDLVRRVLCS